MEGLGHVHGFLSHHGVNDKYFLVRRKNFRDGFQLVHKLSVNVKPSGCVEYYHVVHVGGRVSVRSPYHSKNVILPVFRAVERYL